MTHYKITHLTKGLADWPEYELLLTNITLNFANISPALARELYRHPHATLAMQRDLNKLHKLLAGEEIDASKEIDE